MINKNGITTEIIAQLLFQNILNLYDSLLSLTLDRDPFIAIVWNFFYKIFGTTISLYISFYLQTNRQKKIVNQEIEKHFCTLTNYQKDDVSDKVSVAKFVANNNNSFISKLSAFFPSTDLHSDMKLHFFDISDTITCKYINKKWLWIFLKLCRQHNNICRKHWQKYKWDSQITVINVEKNCPMILEIKYDYLEKISVLINYLKS